jgi:SAM-dependent methyltransferase
MKSVLHYYQDHHFNPVELGIEDPDTWAIHARKRHNLYQNHLGIPLGLLAGKRVLEYGCNSGENAVVLAGLGARLVLVEPNAQVIPRLKFLFDRFSATEQVDDICISSIEDFHDTRTYDLVIAEGFLNTLPQREPMLRKICSQLRPGGLGVIAFDHRCGSLLELLKKAVFFRVLEAAGVDDPHSPPALKIARQLFEEDFKELNASRDFFSWWKDVIVNPFFGGDVFWDYDEILPVIASQDCEIYSTSPRFLTADFHTWYKNVEESKERAMRIQRQIARLAPFFLTGIPELADSARFADSPDVSRRAAEFVRAMAAFTNREITFDEVAEKLMVFELMRDHENPAAQRLARESLHLFTALRTSSTATMLTTWRDSVELRRRWGVPYHYLAFMRSQ